MSETAALPLDRVDPAEAWKPWQPDATQPWNLRWAGHLYRRAAFGAMPDELREAVREGFPATLERLLHGRPPEQETTNGYAAFTTGAAFGRRGDVAALRGWWVARMLLGRHPLHEKMMLFWHNHFATSVAKVQDGILMYQQNELIRQHALSKFGPFLLAMSHDPAMLVWLDSNSNVKDRPNENYARELLELFSLGVGHYTEQDVREAARAFTGWHNQDAHFHFNAAQHDEGRKTVLGQTGDWDGGDVVRIVLEQSAVALFLVRKLYRFFISEADEPPDALLQPLADAFRKSDYDIGNLVTTLLRSQHFFSAHAYRRRIKSPVEYVVGAVRSVGQNFGLPGALIGDLEAMGQHLFAPPNVKGWEGGRRWLNTATVLARHNFAQGLTEGSGKLKLGDPMEPLALAVDPAALGRRARLTQSEQIVAFVVDLLLQGDLRDPARARLIAYLSDGNAQGDELEQRVRETVYLIMTTPEYQLA